MNVKINTVEGEYTVRNINVLLKLLKKEFEGRMKNYAGLCACVNVMCFYDEINIAEEMLINSYIAYHKPFNFRCMMNRPYYWEPGKRRPRIRWCNKHINKTK